LDAHALLSTARKLAVAGTLVGVIAYVSPANTQPVTGASPRLADSGDFVHIVSIARADEDKIVVTIHVDDGFHINANPASQPYLIPTTVSFAGLSPDRVVYPPAIRFKPKFSDEPLDVYEGTVAIVAVFPPEELNGVRVPQVTITVQACTDRICLPPADLTAL
jgi:hypothetical protein